MFTRIVVPLDGSDLALQALARAREMARLYDAPLFFVQVVDPPVSAVLGSTAAGGVNPSASVVVTPSKTTREDDQTNQYIDGMVRQVQAEGIKASGVVLRGRASDGIVNVLNDHDLLVMSSHGRTGMRRWLLGSVAEDVIKKASVSVLLVRSADS